MAANVEEDRFQGLIYGGALAGLAAHVLFLAAFLAVGATILAIVNVGSIVLFAACARLARRRRERLAMSLMQTEVMAHAALAVWFLGWESGFHYYMFCLIPLAIALPNDGTAPRALFLAFIAGLYLALDYSTGLISPLLALDRAVLDAFRAFNILCSLGILGYLVLSLRLAIVKAESRLTDIASTDLLSGLYTRRHGLHLITREMDRSARTGAPLALMLGDIDDFKSVNDRYGHEIGDHLVAAISERLKFGVRKNDMIARWGGDEFLVVLPELSGEDARGIVERVQRTVAADPVHIGDLVIQVSMTCGVTEYSRGDTVEDCVRRADAALYDGKRLGRNQVVLATGPKQNT